VANGLDIVSIGIQHECAVVVFVIVRSRTRGAIVSAAGGECGSVELIHLCMSCGPEGDMDPRLVGSALAHPEIRFRRNPVAEDGSAAGVLYGNLHHHLVAQGCEGMLVKSSASCRIANQKAGVVDHELCAVGGESIHGLHKATRVRT
jgi:hypothetical protein